MLLGQVLLARQIYPQCEQHPDARRAETVMPAHGLAQRADDQWRGDDPGVDRQVEDLESVATAQVGRLVERADLAGDVALEHPAAQDQAQQREQEGGVEGHQEVARRHRHRAQYHRAALAQQPVGHEPAKDRGQIDAGGICAEDGAGELLPFDPAIQRAQLLDPGDLLDVAGQQQRLSHVQDQQRLHPVIRETLPRFGEG